MFLIDEKEVCEDYEFSSTAIESDTSPEKTSKKLKMKTRCLVSHFCNQLLLEKLNWEIKQRQKNSNFFFGS